MEQGTAYEMPESDSLYLESVAQSVDASSGYARAILGLLFGREFYDQLDGLVEVKSIEKEDALEGNAIKPLGTTLVSPNPANNEFRVTLGLPASVLKVTSMIGQEVFKQNISENDEIIHVNTKQWAKGIYALQLLNGNGEVLHAELLVITH